MQRIVRYMKWLLTASGIVAMATAVGGVGLSGASAKGFKGTIKVNVVSDFTGDLEVANGMKGALAYFDSVNATGGIDGYKIVAKEFDTQSSPTTAVQAVRSAVAGKPTAILGGSFVISTALPSLAQSGVPAVGDGFAAGWTGHKTMFPIAGDEAGHISNVLAAVDKKFGGAKKVALLGSSLYPADLKNLSQHIPNLGVKVVFKDLTLPLVPTSAQLLTAAEQIKAAGAQGVVAIGVEDLAAIQVDLNQLGAKVSVVTTDFYPPTKSEDGLIYSEPWADSYIKGNPGVTQFVAAMTKFGYAKDIDSDSFAPVRWAEAALLVHGLEVAGPQFSHKALVKALGTTENFTADGIVPPASYPKFQKIGDNCQTALKVVNGKWVPELSGPSPFLCGGPSLPDAS
ncbi:MAG TPA: ABC transporter substrate-binding protein [Solirubrobacteraceae bacterium]|nr:ABC transporter substrate-binding protein [Solirubrobacteraceae bacterium]